MPIVVVNIKQRHTSPNLSQALAYAQSESRLGRYENEFNQVAESQHKIAKRLTSQKKKLPVISENLSSESPQQAQLSHLVNTHFADGIPDNFDDLNFLQKKLLVQFGATRVLQASGQINLQSDHPSNIAISYVPNAAQKFTQMSDGQTVKFNTGREYKSLEQAQQVAEQQQSDEVALVTGFMHDYATTKICFPNIDLDVLDLGGERSNSEKEEASAVADVIKANTINCDAFKTFDSAKFLAKPDAGYVTTSQTSSISIGAIASGLIATGVLIYGAMRLFAPAKKNTQEANVTSVQAKKSSYKPKHNRK